MKLFDGLYTKPRDLQVEAVAKVLDAHKRGARYAILEAPTGCHAKGSLILLSDGRQVPVEELRIGDRLFGAEGSYQTITQLVRGRQEMARIVPVKGDPFEVNLDHLLTLSRRDGELVDVPVRAWLSWAKARRLRHKLARWNGPAVFERGNPGASSPLHIDPYLLGLFLGSEVFGQALTINTKAPEVHTFLTYIVGLYRGTFKLLPTALGWVMATSKRGALNPFILAARKMGLDERIRAQTKFVPDRFKCTDWSTRRHVLAGLIDIDGSLDNGCFEYVSPSRRLADDVVFMARSLGLAAYLSPKGTHFRVCISGDLTRIPTRIKRKQSKLGEQAKNACVVGFNVELLPEADYYGFTLDGSGRFLMGDFTITHNCGKTGIAIALAKHFKRAFVGTLTAQLQEQYASLFPSHGIEKLLGAGKFKCSRIRGICMDGRKEYLGEDSCEAHGGCPYMAQKRRALEAPICVGNFHSLLYNVAWAKGSDEDDESLVQKVRPFFVGDEIHAAETWLLGVTELTIRLNQFSFQTEALPAKGEDIEAYWLWLKAFSSQLAHELDEGHFPDSEDKEKAEDIKRRVNFALDSRAEESWIPERGEREDGSLDPTWFSLKPLTVKRWGHWLWGRGDFSLLMTATVISPGSLATGLGLDLNDGDYIEMPCPFPVENRPIYATRLDMSMRARDTSWPLMVAAIENLLNHHSAHKGLILTPSNKMMDYIMKGVGRKNAARLIPAAGENREQKYREHFLRKDASVLLASGFWEGADLKDDAARFTIIPQLPRPFWAGQIKARAAIEPGWYEFKTWQKMIQGLGRCVRSDSDSSVSYVLDKAFLLEMDKPKPLIPTWMRGAVKELP